MGRAAAGQGDRAHEPVLDEPPGTAADGGNRRDEGRRLRRQRRAGVGSPVAYDEELARRIRWLLVDEADVTETKMFGGLAFLVGGNMAVAASGQSGLMVRVDVSESDELVAT